VSKRLKDIWHLNGGSLATYAKMVGALDESVGRVLAALDQNGLAENTIVIFTSDNGGERFSDNWPFTGQKSELLEGGIRVPALIRWPARIASGVSDQVTITMDWLPTLLAAAQSKADPAFPPDGDDLLPVLLGKREPYARTLYWRYTLHRQRALRIGDLKYLQINGREYLFDLAQDVRERANLAGTNVERLAAMRAQWDEWNGQMLPLRTDGVASGPNARQHADRYFVPSTPAPAPREGSSSR
jgi:arylsulfatase A-like enzyme